MQVGQLLTQLAPGGVETPGSVVVHPSRESPAMSFHTQQRERGGRGGGGREGGRDRERETEMGGRGKEEKERKRERQTNKEGD